jgi:polyferredoxin
MSDQVPDISRIHQRLRIVRWVGLLDLALLITLVASSISGNREAVSILGPLHGGNFLLLMVLVSTAAADRFWSWWYPLGVLVTGGPVGALIGEWLIRKRLSEREPLPASDVSMLPGSPDGPINEAGEGS